MNRSKRMLLLPCGKILIAYNMQQILL